MFQVSATLRCRAPRLRIRLAASSSAMKRSMTASSTAAGVIRRRLAQRAKRERPLRTRGSVTACNSLVQSSVEFDAGGLEHRQQTGGIEGGGEVAAQVRPPLARDLGLRRHHAVEGLADIGEVERDLGRPAIRQLGVGDHRRPQIALARLRQAAAGEPVDDVLQRGRRGGRGDRIMFHLHLLRCGRLGSRPDGSGQGVTFGNSIMEQMERLFHKSIPDDAESVDISCLWLTAADIARDPGEAPKRPRSRRPKRARCSRSGEPEEPRTLSSGERFGS